MRDRTHSVSEVSPDKTRRYGRAFLRTYQEVRVGLREARLGQSGMIWKPTGVNVGKSDCSGVLSSIESIRGTTPAFPNHGGPPSLRNAKSRSKLSSTTNMPSFGHSYD